MMANEVCNYCGDPNSGLHKKIRTGFICQQCLNQAIDHALVAKNNLQSAVLTANGILALLSVLGGVFALTTEHPWVAGFLVIMAFIFGSGNDEKKTPKEDEKRKNLEAIEYTARSKLQSIYSQFIELPPDWQERRKAVRKRDNSKCRECGKKFYSIYGFHLHHIIPKSKPDSSHKLSNLTLLCERCHKKHPPWMR